MTVPVLEVAELTNLDAWLRSVLWDSKLPGSIAEDAHIASSTPEVHRLKAMLPLSNGDVKIVQGVREIFEILDAPTSNVQDTRRTIPTHGKIVLIGRNLDLLKLEKSFKYSLR